MSTFKTLNEDDPFKAWRPVRARYMERFKDRAWRLFGAHVPVEKRPQIKARFEWRREAWTRKRVDGLIGQTLRAHEKQFVENLTQDFVLLKILDNIAMPKESLGGIVPFSGKKP